MAMLNIGEVLNTMVRGNSFEAKIEANVATAAFAPQVRGVLESAMEGYEASAESSTALAAAGKISNEQALFIVESRKQMVMDARSFSSRYFAG